MNGEWCYFKERFTKEDIDFIITEGLKLPVQEAKLGPDGETSLDNYRKSKIRFIQSDDTKFNWLFRSLWDMALQANDEWFNFHISRLSYIQLAEYDESYQGEYKKHQDVFWMNGDPKYHRKLSCIVQLTDPSDYQGGNFELFNTSSVPDVEELRTKGTTIFIPSFIEHQATPVTKGTRYSLAAWFDGPKWR
jgi:PKHD-type hydroxylase